jgi:glycosyltransferase involved in cell wall biosynthesis
LQDVAASCDMREFVQFVGRVQPEEIQAYLSIADVVPIPRKPFKVCEVVTPLKPLEAMSMEKPVILTNLAALREMIIDGETGLLCKPADPEDLAAVLKRLADDPELRQRLGTTARKWVSEHRSWSGAAAGLKRLYAEMIPLQTAV